MISAIRINPDDRGYFSKLLKKKKQFPDYFTGFIADKQNATLNTKTNIWECDDNDMLAKLEGEWTNYLNIDGKEVWKQKDQVILPIEKMPFTLKSDSQLREDILLYKNGFDDYAQEAKVFLEERQRNDRHLRSLYTKKEDK
jgi:hypothetical protein